MLPPELRCPVSCLSSVLRKCNAQGSVRRDVLPALTRELRSALEPPSNGDVEPGQPSDAAALEWANDGQLVGAAEGVSYSPRWIREYLELEAALRPTTTSTGETLSAWHQDWDPYAHAVGALLPQPRVGTGGGEHLLGELLRQRDCGGAEPQGLPADDERDVASVLAGLVTYQFHAVLGRALAPRSWLSYAEVSLRAAQLLCYSLIASSHRGYECRFGLRPIEAPGRDLALRIVAASAGGDQTARALLASDEATRRAIHALLTRGYTVLPPPCAGQLTQVRAVLRRLFGEAVPGQRPPGAALVTVRDVLMFSPSDGSAWREKYCAAAAAGPGAPAELGAAAPVVGVLAPKLGGMGLAAFVPDGWSPSGQAPCAPVNSRAAFHGQLQVVGTPEANQLPPGGILANRYQHILCSSTEFIEAEGGGAGGEDPADSEDVDGDSTGLEEEEPARCFVMSKFPGPGQFCACKDPRCGRSRRRRVTPHKRRRRRGEDHDDDPQLDPDSVEQVSSEFGLANDEDDVKRYAEQVLCRDGEGVRRAQALRWARHHVSLVLNCAQYTRGEHDYCTANFVNMANEDDDGSLVNSVFVHEVVALPRPTCPHVTEEDDGLIPQVFLQIITPDLVCDGSAAVLANYDQDLRGPAARAKFLHQPHSVRVEAARSARALLQSLSRVDGRP